MIKLRADGWTVCLVERWIPASHAGYRGPIIRRDAFGFGDILAVHPLIKGALLVQSTTGSNAAKRVNKILATKEARAWLASNNLIHVHGWAKRGAAGQRKLWTCRVESVEMGKTTYEIQRADE